MTPLAFFYACVFAVTYLYNTIMVSYFISKKFDDMHSKSKKHYLDDGSDLYLVFSVITWFAVPALSFILFVNFIEATGVSEQLLLLLSSCSLLLALNIILYKWYNYRLSIKD